MLFLFPLLGKDSFGPTLHKHVVALLETLQLPNRQLDSRVSVSSGGLCCCFCILLGLLAE